MPTLYIKPTHKNRQTMFTWDIERALFRRGRKQRTSRWYLFDEDRKVRFILRHRPGSWGYRLYRRTKSGSMTFSHYVRASLRIGG